MRLTKQNLGWPTEPAFLVPDAALAHFREAAGRGRQHESQWRARIEAYAAVFPDLARELQQRIEAKLPAGWDADILVFTADDKGMATRVASGWRYAGRNLHFGVREHAMGAIVNGLAAHGGNMPFGATFLIFSDYMRPSMRLAALMDLHVVFVFTHDSIAVGEDGPTHQPVEQLAGLRAMPNLSVIRPGDANETAVAWRVALEATGQPVVPVLTRQKLPTLDRTTYGSADGLRQGAYVLMDAPGGKPDLILIASGSEVALVLAAGRLLAAEHIATRIVSMPSWDLFDAQPPDYRHAVLPPSVKARLAVEAGATQGWHRYVGDDGDVLGVDRFGASAPGDVVMREYGFTVDNVCARARSLLRR